MDIGKIKAVTYSILIERKQDSNGNQILIESVTHYYLHDRGHQPLILCKVIVRWKRSQSKRSAAAGLFNDGCLLY